MEVSKRGSRKRRVELGAIGQEGARNRGSRLPLRRPRVTVAPWLGGEPPVVRLPGTWWPERSLLAGCFCLVALAPALAAAVVGVQASSWSHFWTLGGLPLLLIEG